MREGKVPREGRSGSRCRSHSHGGAKRLRIPARAAGLKSVSIVAREIHDRLSLSAAHANACQALRGRKFQGMAGVLRPKVEGPMASGTAAFTYELGSVTMPGEELLRLLAAANTSGIGGSTGRTRKHPAFA